MHGQAFLEQMILPSHAHLRGERHPHQRAAVEGAFQHHDGRPFDAALVAVQSRQLDGRFIGLGAGVAEEAVVHARYFCQRCAQLLLDLDAAMKDLAELDPESAEVAQLRIFGGLGETQVASILDISERNRAEQALRESEARFHGAFESSPHGMALVAPDGRWLEINPALCEITGYDEVSLQPNAGSQGELAGLLAIAAYHRSRGEDERRVCLIPSSAHGTNAASAVIAGFRCKAVACDAAGNVDVDDLRAKCEANAAELGALMNREMGKPLAETRGDMQEGIDKGARLAFIAHDNPEAAAGDAVRLLDRDGEMRAVVGLADDGTPFVQFLDERKAPTQTIR